MGAPARRLLAEVFPGEKRNLTSCALLSSNLYNIPLSKLEISSSPLQISIPTTPPHSLLKPETPAPFERPSVGSKICYTLPSPTTEDCGPIRRSDVLLPSFVGLRPSDGGAAGGRGRAGLMRAGASAIECPTGRKAERRKSKQGES